MSQSRGSFNRARIFARTNSETCSLTSGSTKSSTKDAIQNFSEPSSQISSSTAPRRSGVNPAHWFSKSNAKPLNVWGTC